MDNADFILPELDASGVELLQKTYLDKGNAVRLEKDTLVSMDSIYAGIEWRETRWRWKIRREGSKRIWDAIDLIMPLQGFSLFLVLITSVR